MYLTPKISPHTKEFELELLVIFMAYPKRVGDILLRIKPEHFSYEAHRDAYAHLLDLYHRGLPTDLVTAVQEALKPAVSHTLNRAVAEQSGTSEHRLAYLIDSLLNNHFALQASYIYNELGDVIRDKPERKAILDVVGKMIALTTRDNQEASVPAKQAALQGYERFLERYANPNADGRIRFGNVLGAIGIPSLDRISAGGVKGGDLILVAAQSGEGKTAFALALAQLASVWKSHETYYMNTEMEIDELTARMVASLMTLPFGEVYSGLLTGTKTEIEEKLKQIDKGYGLISKSNVTFSRLPELDRETFKALARQHKIQKGKLDMLFIDYIGRLDLDADIQRLRLREDQVLARIVKEAKVLAQELDCVVVVLAQLNDEMKLEGAKRMINDTDITLFVEPLTDSELAEAKNKNVTHFAHIRKARRGNKNNPIRIAFNKASQKLWEVPDYFGDNVDK